MGTLGREGIFEAASRQFVDSSKSRRHVSPPAPPSSSCSLGWGSQKHGPAKAAGHSRNLALERSASLEEWSATLYGGEFRSLPGLTSGAGST
jgi:hypothetical protein